MKGFVFRLVLLISMLIGLQIISFGLSALVCFLAGVTLTKNLIILNYVIMLATTAFVFAVDNKIE